MRKSKVAVAAALAFLLIAAAPKAKKPSISFTETKAGLAVYDVVELHLNAHDSLELKLFWKKPDGDKARFGNFQTLQDWLKRKHQELLFATNAGMFASDKDLYPVGLHIENGSVIRPINLHSPQPGEGFSNFTWKPN